jgi:hypothetical protein
MSEKMPLPDLIRATESAADWDALNQITDDIFLYLHEYTPDSHSDVASLELGRQLLPVRERLTNAVKIMNSRNFPDLRRSLVNGLNLIQIFNSQVPVTSNP